MKLVVTLVLTIAAVFALPVENGFQEISPNFDALRDTVFLVFTRFNPTLAQIVDINDMSTVRNSNYDPTRPTRVIIHGQLSDGQSELNIVLTAAYLASSDVNVIVVDWGEFKLSCMKPIEKFGFILQVWELKR
jgi:Lipase